MDREGTSMALWRLVLVQSPLPSLFVFQVTKFFTLEKQYCCGKLFCDCINMYSTLVPEPRRIFLSFSLPVSVHACAIQKKCGWFTRLKLSYGCAGRQPPTRVMLLYEDNASNGCQESPLIQQTRSVTASTAHGST